RAAARPGARRCGRSARPRGDRGARTVVDAAPRAEGRRRARRARAVPARPAPDLRRRSSSGDGVVAPPLACGARAHRAPRGALDREGKAGGGAPRGALSRLRRLPAADAAPLRALARLARRRPRVEAADAGGDRAVELLHDLIPPLAPDHALDPVVLVAVREQEVRPVGPNLLVVGERRVNGLRAPGVGALADELRVWRLEPLRALRDPLVDVPEERLGVGDS